MLGKKLFTRVMKMTFFGQFVAGENEEDIRPLIERNKLFGVKSILDYSAEKDISREEAEQAEMEYVFCIDFPQNLRLKYCLKNVQNNYA